MGVFSEYRRVKEKRIRSPRVSIGWPDENEIVTCTEENRARKKGKVILPVSKERNFDLSSIVGGTGGDNLAKPEDGVNSIKIKKEQAKFTRLGTYLLRAQIEQSWGLCKYGGKPQTWKPLQGKKKTTDEQFRPHQTPPVGEKKNKKMGIE